MEQPGRGGQHGVALRGLFLVAHAEVAAGTFEIQDVLVFGARLGLGGQIVELEAGILLQNLPVALGLQLVDDVVGRRGHDQRCFELDLAIGFFDVLQHLRDDLHVALVHHARADKAQIDLFRAAVIGHRADRVMGVAFRHVRVVHVRVGDHRLVDQVQIHDDLGEVFRVVIGSERRLLARADLGDAGIGLVDQALQRARGILHTLVDHDLDARLGDLQRFDQRLVLADADRGLGLHLGRPVGEGKGLVGQERADMHLDDAALEHVVAALLQHLRLGCVHHIAEVHMRLHPALEGNLDRLRDRHGRLARGQRQRDGARVGAKGHALGHAGMAVAADDDGPVIHGDVVQHLVDHVGHRVIDALRVARGDQAEVVHEFHELRNVFLRLLVPDRGGVAARLIGAVHNGRNDGRGHRLKLLRGHQAGGVLRADDVDAHAHVGSGMQHLARRHADGIAVEDLFDGGQALPFDGDLLVRGKDRRRLDAQRLRGKGLQLLAKDDGVRAAGLHELHLLRGERGRHVDQFLTGLVAELLVLGVDDQHGAGGDRVFLFKDRVAVVVQDRLAVRVGLAHPVLQVDADAAGHVHRGGKDRRDAVGARDDGGVVHEGHIGAGLLASPERDVVHARHARRADAHGALFGDQHHAFVGMLGLQRDDLGLRFGRDHAFAVQFAVGTRMRLIAGRQQVGRDIAFGGDIGHDLDLVIDLGQLGKKLGLGIALQDVGGDRVASLVGIGQTGHVGVVKKDLRLEHIARTGGDGGIRTQCQIQQNLDRGAALHVRQQFQREFRADLGDQHLAKDHLFQERSLDACGAGGARQGVVDEKVQTVASVRAVIVGDVLDQLGHQRAVIDRLGVQTLRLAGFDFS